MKRFITLIFFKLGVVMAFSLSSAAFQQESLIPPQYTCDGVDISPQLAWTDAPKNTQSFALIFDDPDAPMGNWVHWVLFNIPAHITELSEDAKIPAGAKDGLNSWGRLGYGGPCPPDRIHRYYFKLYALDTVLDIPERSKKEDVEKAMNGHILAKAELMGRYDRPHR